MPTRQSYSSKITFVKIMSNARPKKRMIKSILKSGNVKNDEKKNYFVAIKKRFKHFTHSKFSAAFNLCAVLA